MHASEGNIGNCLPSKTTVNLCFASVHSGFLGVTIIDVTFSCSQYIYFTKYVKWKIYSQWLQYMYSNFTTIFAFHLHTHTPLPLAKIIFYINLKFWAQVSFSDCLLSVCLLSFHIFIFFSRTTGQISTNLGLKHPWVKGIQVYSKWRII